MTLVEFFKRNRKTNIQKRKGLLVRTLTSVVKSLRFNPYENTDDCSLNVVNYTSYYESSLYSTPIYATRNRRLIYYYHGRAFQIPANKINVSEELSNSREFMYGLKLFNPLTGSLTTLDCTEEEAIEITKRTLRELEEGRV
jgi:hypothetical protein